MKNISSQRLDHRRFYLEQWNLEEMKSSYFALTRRGVALRRARARDATRRAATSFDDIRGDSVRFGWFQSAGWQGVAPPRAMHHSLRSAATSEPSATRLSSPSCTFTLSPYSFPVCRSRKPPLPLSGGSDSASTATDRPPTTYSNSYYLLPTTRTLLPRVRDYYHYCRCCYYRTILLLSPSSTVTTGHNRGRA